MPEINCPMCSAASFEIVTYRFDSGRIVRCAECGHIYLNPTLSDAVLRSIYENYHGRNNDRALMSMIEGWFIDPAGPYQFALKLIEAEGGFEGQNVLEIGCGPGHFLNACQARGARITGVDLSPHAVELAKAEFGIDVIHSSFEVAASEGVLPKQNFDLIFAFEVIEHVKEPGVFLTLVYDLLKPGGRLVLSTPNFGLYYLMGKAAPAVNNWPEPVHFFDPDSLVRAVTRFGFESAGIVTLALMNYGDRQKQKLVRNNLIAAMWRKLRSVAWIYRIKDSIFGYLDHYKEPADIKSLNGNDIFCCARRPSAVLQKTGVVDKVSET